MIDSNSKIYHWVDTGVDIVDINRKISLKVSGSANFCAPIVISNTSEDGEMSLERIIM